MGSALFSFVIWCSHDVQNDTLQVRVVPIDTSKDVQFKDSSFLLRVFVDESTLTPRCFLRHVNSGREVYIQGSSNLLPFIKGCLATGEETEAHKTHE